MAVSTKMGAMMQVALAGNYTAREDVITVSPLEVEEVPMFNPQGGYGTSILPAVLMLIIQQTLALGIGLAAGTSRERNPYGDLVPVHPAYSGIYRIVGGKALCYLMVYAVMGAYLVMAVPKMFSFLQIASWQSLLALMVPYLLACIFFGMTVS
jgi:ABC-2 type transport system permease protein